MKFIFLFCILSISSEIGFCQGKITFIYPDRKEKSQQDISNRSDSAIITLEEGFNSDTVEFDINNKKFSQGICTTSGLLGLADYLLIPKISGKEMISIKINNVVFKNFVLNKDYTLLYLNYEPGVKKLKIEYSVKRHFYL